MFRKPRWPKALLSFVAVLAPVALIAMLCMLLLFFHMNRQMRDEIDAQQLRELSRVQMQAETFLSDLRKRVFALNLDTRSSTLNRSALPWTAETIYTAYELIRQVNTVQTLSFVQSFPGYYMPAANAVLNATAQYTLEQYYTAHFRNRFGSAAEMQAALAQNTAARFLPVRTSKGEAFLLCSHMSAGASPYFAFALVPVDSLVEQLFPARNYGHAQIRLWENGTQTVLYETADFSAPPVQGQSVAHGKDGWVHFCTEPDALGLSYHLALPEDALYAHLARVNRQIVLLMGALVAVGIGLACLMIRRAYRPIRHLMELSLAQTDGLPIMRNEWALIEWAFTSMAERRDAVYAHQREEVRALSLKGALLGAGGDSERGVPCGPCALLSPYPPPGEQDLGALEAVLQETGAAHVCTFMPDAYCILLYAPEPKAVAEALLARVDALLSVAISARLEAPEGLARGYQQVRMLLRILAETGQRGAFAYEDLPDMLAGQVDKVFPQQTQERFLAAALSGNEESARAILREFLSRLDEAGAASFPLAQGVLMNLFGACGEGAGEALRAVAASESLDGLRAAVEKPFATGGVHAQPRAGAEDNFTMRRIQAYMEENFADPNLSAASLAERFGVSASYLSRAFKRQTGDTPIDYLHKCRLNRAKALLRDTTASVKDIAQAVGYPDSGALLRQMRKYEGVTPGQYRASTLE